MTFTIYGFTTELASLIGVDRGVIRGWLHNKSNTYIKYGIIGISYLNPYQV